MFKWNHQRFEEHVSKLQNVKATMYDVHQEGAANSK